MNILHLLLALLLTYLPIVGCESPLSNCTVETFEDNSSITHCEETREGVMNLCTYLRDEFDDLIYWECTPIYG
jgi:hypothetical protein